MEFRELKNDHASLKHPSSASPGQFHWSRARVIPDITSYVIHIGTRPSRLCLHNATIPGDQPTVSVHDNRHTEFSQNGVP